MLRFATERAGGQRTEGFLAEERRRLYRMARLRVGANPDKSLELTGASLPGFTPPETVLR
jgi:hypothetical protein